MKLTSREKEIVNFLKKNPLISQEDLAEVFGITRSSVAVHISNLMKKGIILGRGYVFNEGASITVLGECLLEIDILEENGSLATIDMKYRGAPIDVSAVFCNYGIKPKVLTFLGNDEVGRFFLNKLQSLELDTSTVFRHASKRSCRRVYINKKLFYLENMLNVDYNKAIDSREWLITNCEWLIVDNKFAQGIIERLTSKKVDGVPQLCTYIIGGDSPKIPDYIDSCAIVVFGVEDMAQGEIISDELLKLNTDLGQIFIITDGISEIIAIKNKKISSFPLLPNQGFSIVDKLPVFLAGFVYGILNDHPLRQAIRIAIGSI